jgi:hypothetical protein
MTYDYQKLVKEKAEKDKGFAKELNEIREQRKKIVGEEVGTSVIGNIAVGRPTLGGVEFVKNFRILRMIGLRWNLSGLLGDKASNGLVYSIGVRLGRDILNKGLIEKAKKPDEFVNSFSDFVQDMKIGVVSVLEWKNDLPRLIRIEECITCAGVLNVGGRICHYEGGIIAGIISEYINKLVVVEEVSCWGLGDESCDFKVEIQ